jgi:hypothetical protein
LEIQILLAFSALDLSSCGSMAGLRTATAGVDCSNTLCI